MKDVLNFIDGEFRASRSGKWLQKENPATGEILARVTRSNAQDVADAVAAAQAAFPQWSQLPSRTRSHYLRALAQGIHRRMNELVQAEVLDTGKPISVAAAVDIPRAAYNFEFFADACTQFASESHSDYGHINYTLRQALGVVACISPWNLPLYLFTWKIAPALAAGNTVIAKPSEITPSTASLLAEICAEVDLPPGVLNILQGDGPDCGQAMVEHPLIKAISFTGSTAVGKKIAELAASKFKKCSLEMGGKNPLIIFADADLKKASTQAVRAGFSNQGQICLCASRILIEEKVYSQVRDQIVTLAQQLQPSNPMSLESRMGSLVSKTHFDKVSAYLDLARSEGGKILCGGKSIELPAPNQKGYFLLPTVIEGLSNLARCNQEEIFGPIVTLQSFSTEAEALSLSNGTEYGLAVSCWTRDIQRVQRMSRGLDFGIVWINSWMERDLRTPFGGFKNSGLGREGGWEAMRFFTECKNISLLEDRP